MIRVLIAGAAGRMGREMSRALWNAEDIELVGAVDPYAEGVDIGRLMEIDEVGIPVRPDLAGSLGDLRPDVLVDFTTPDVVYNNIRTALDLGVRPVVGTTGMSAVQIDDIKETCSFKKTGCIIAPNFAIGALLMIKFAADACRHFPHVEIIELHHEKKCDAPSGTAIKTAEVISRFRGESRQGLFPGEEKIAGARGAKFEDGGIRIHSVRLPGLMAHQEVIFGGLGQTLTIRHDSISRESFVPGVVLAVRKVMGLSEMIYGLENIIFNNESVALG